jgi:(p)ppGpp synthase/HD superfamily hydrolase
MVGVLHDVVEDTDVTIEEIREVFGDEIATMLSFVTDVSTPEDGNRRVRKKIDREHAAAGCVVSQTVKVCDIMSNSRSITTDDVSFAAVYVPEKLIALNVFTRAVEEARREAYHMLVDCILKVEQAGHGLRWDRVIA